MTVRDDAGMVTGRDYELERMPLYREYIAAVMADTSAEATRDIIKDAMSLDYTPSMGDDVPSATTYDRYMVDAYAGTDDTGEPMRVSVASLMTSPWDIHVESRLSWRVARGRMQSGKRPRARGRLTLSAPTSYTYRAPRRNHAIRETIIREIVHGASRIYVTRMTSARVEPLAHVSYTFERLDAMRALRDQIKAMTRKASDASRKRVSRANETPEQRNARREADAQHKREQRAQLRAMRAEAESRMTIAEAMREGVSLPSTPIE